MSCLLPFEVAGLSMLSGDDPERMRADAHAAVCPHCAAALKNAERTLLPLEDLAPQPASGADLAAVQAGLFATLRRDAQRVAQEGWAVLVGAAVALTGLFLFMPIASRGGLEHVESLVALLVALFAVFYATSTHRGKLAVGVVLACSLSLIALEVDGDLDPSADHGAMCSSMMGAVAIFPALVAGWLSLRAMEPGAGWRIAARAGAAALAAQGALALMCTYHGVLHLVPFHFLGLVAVMLFGGALPSLLRRLRPAA